MKHIEIIVDLDTNDKFRRFMKALEAAGTEQTETLTLRFWGSQTLDLDQALFLHDYLLAHPDLAAKLITIADSSLVGAGPSLLWLCGQRRRLRRDGWLYLEPLPTAKPKKNPFHGGADWWKEAEDDFDPFANAPWCFTMISPHWLADLATVHRYINAYLPVEELAGRHIPYAVLKELGLLESEKLDRALTQVFGRKAPGLPGRLSSGNDLPPAQPQPSIDLH